MPKLKREFSETKNFDIQRHCADKYSRLVPINYSEDGNAKAKMGSITIRLTTSWRGNNFGGEVLSIGQ